MENQEPTLDGFKAFIGAEMQVPPSAQPSEAIIDFVFGLAKDLAIPEIRCVSVRVYAAAVYNLAASNLIQFAQDDPKSATPSFWKTLRGSLGMNSFTPGLIASSADNGTSQSWFIPDAFKDLSIADLQALKNPYGQFYLSLAQQYGTVWAMV
ncbi:hypothetical protein GS501_00020 [Saccharibacter sp. 17.LH.SD]|uniref:hypothetical protein n=1 Tax=Saccharibacter sp. 17.LH.SD TaxID=2689393 RepID=UPI001371772B|nr:hypothetical protein [Saccharibacter sp. 17.LH.SD]MXV43466.1 hypothetical protein [Saccharibacter sp. 17.LH.SD]